MKYYLNGIERTVSKTMGPRKVQKEAIRIMVAIINSAKKVLINMPCRTGKTFSTLYSAYIAGVKLVIVLCGKASAKASYDSDSAWINSNTGAVEGFNKVFTANKSVKEVLANLDSIEAGDRVLIEITPQLLNRNPDLVTKLGELAKVMKTLFVFDEAHFTERTDKTKAIVSGITGEQVVAEEKKEDDTAIDQDIVRDNFEAIPWVYLTASPDTESLHNMFLKNTRKHIYTTGAEYYELTKEKEWELYLEDLKLPEEQREFNYVPVRNCLYLMNKLMDSVYNSAKCKKQDYTSLFTQANARHAASKFVLKTLVRVINVLKAGPEASFLKDDLVNTYTQRGTNLNLMIKVPQNSKKTNNTDKTVAELVTELINENKVAILAQFPEYTDINILDVTLANNISQDAANAFFDNNKTAVNIILTQQRLIEGCTLYNLDAFLYYTNSGSLCKYKQESGRTLTPVTGKRFGFIFFFDEVALANVKAMLQAKIIALKGGKRKGGAGTKKLSEEESKKLTRINPAFISGNNDEMKLLDYSASLYSKTELEKSRTKGFDNEALFSQIPELQALVLNLLGKLTNNTTEKKPHKPSEGNGNGGKHKPSDSPKANEDTPVEELETEKFYNAIFFTYQLLIQLGEEATTLTDKVLATAKFNGLDPKATTLLYENEYAYNVLMEIYEVLKRDQKEVNPEEVK